mmetsp:Transcript_5025/g.4595  ORF Transcript_5025/g.4595 Transcript_5025/m.4595 type:complete len:140 (+) Transcript_5025:1523-1942(+)
MQETKEKEDARLKALFLGESHGHFKIGSFLRIEVRIEKQYSRQLSPDYPIVLCALRQQESNFAFMRVKIKKHRWYPHILKNQDPLLFSIGWRKFQSIPTYLSEDDSDRLRMIKYTPKFGYCLATFFGPTYPVGTSFVGI